MRTSHITDVFAWLASLRDLCAKQRQLTLRLHKQTTVHPDRFWAGVSFCKSVAVNRLRHALEEIARTHVRKGEFRPLLSPLHLTLTFPAKVEHVQKETLTVRTLCINRLTILEQKERNGAYYVHTHLPFG